MDRVYLAFGIPYQGALQVMRILWVVLPVVMALVTVRVCRSLQRSELHPLRGVTARVVTREAGGGFAAGPAMLANPSWTPEVVDPDAPRDGLADELRGAAKRGALAAGITGTGGVLLAVGVSVLAVALAAVLSIWLPAWAATLIAAVVFAVVAVLLVLVARRTVSREK
jgi:membrane protein implicated in regulation of membrane protease activity